MSQPVTEESGIQKEWYAEADKIKSLDELVAFVRRLTEDYNHDYGTICHAVAAAGIAAMHAVDRAPCGGITGFQAGAIIWEVIEHWGAFDEGPKKILCYQNMLYPQYDEKFEKRITPATWAYLQEEARKNLKNGRGYPVHEAVVAHWQSIAEGTVPFGYRVVERD